MSHDHDECASRFVIAAAQPASELSELFDMINEAFDVELGDTGVAFKKDRRFLSHDELTAKLAACRTLVCRAHDDARILGAICFDISASEPETLQFGPFAVAPHAQGRGVGRALLERVYSIARLESCAHVDIEVVDHRTDTLVMYERMGYVRTGEQPFPFPERCTRPSKFVLMRKSLE